VAAHSWGVAALVLEYLPDDLDRSKALIYAILHDLPEVRTGDLTPGDVARLGLDKAALEARAVEGLAAVLPRGARLAGWIRDYEDQADPESRFVRQLDRLDMALQALAYHEAHGTDVIEFFDSADPVITHPTLRAVFDAARARLGRPSSR
jgi:putative hydrolase of HD superfamily